MGNRQTTTMCMLKSTIPLPNKQHEDQLDEDDATENNAIPFGHGRLCRRLPAELLCEMAKRLPWKVRRRQPGYGKNMRKKKKNHAELLLANHALSIFLGARFRQFRAKHKKDRAFKERIVFSGEQVARLENSFEIKKYLNNNERQRLAAELDLNCSQVKIWYQNRRAKWRRQ